MELRAEAVDQSYRDFSVLRDFSLSINGGSRVAIIGANGSGKSTILKTLARILKPKKGLVSLDGRSLSAYDTAALARRLAVLPQIHGRVEDLRVSEFVALGRFAHRTKGGDPRAREAVERAIDLVGLSTLRDRFLSSLSGGEARRVWLALSLAQEPELLLLDEPTAFLDIRHQFEILDLVRSLNERHGLTVVMVLHDLNLAARYAERLVAIRAGKIVADGAPSSILTKETIDAVFGVTGSIVHVEGYPHFIPTGKI